MNTNDADQSEVFAVLAELARCYPHWRLGQLIVNVAGWADADVWDAEDDKMLAAVKAHLAKLARQSDHASGRTPALLAARSLAATSVVEGRR